MDSTSPSPKKSGGGKAFALFVVVVLIGLVVVLDLRRRDAEAKLAQLSMQMQGDAGNQEQNREAARLIIDKVKKLYTIEDGIEPTVATIVDVTQLRAKNAFYNKAKNGDHLIVTSDRAILYDPVADKIIDVVPVQIQAPAAASSSSAVAPKK